MVADDFPLHYTRKNPFCTVGGGTMQEFNIALCSFKEVQEFVSLATVQPFPVLVGNDMQQVNGKSFIGMVSLDYTRPLLVQADCDESAVTKFQKVISKFLTE